MGIHLCFLIDLTLRNDPLQSKRWFRCEGQQGNPLTFVDGIMRLSHFSEPRPCEGTNPPSLRVCNVKDNLFGIGCSNSCSTAKPPPFIMPSKDFESYFSEDNIIDQLCRARIKLAKRRNDREFLHRISVSEDGGTELPDESLDGMFPSRRLWAKFRPNARHRRFDSDSGTFNLKALKKAVFKLRNISPKPGWAVCLHNKVNEIRKSILTGSFEFSHPRIHFELKDAGKQSYRPLVEFKIEEKIVDSLTARYLRSRYDHLLSPSCLAFRISQSTQGLKNTHSSLDHICDFRSDNDANKLFVAEADIRSFFDCVSHKVALASLARLEDRLVISGTKSTLSTSALKIVESYLRSYNFNTTVLKCGQEELQKKHGPRSHFPWPKSELQKLHQRKKLPFIGIPQGGALSCFFANAVLHQADDAIELVRRTRKKAICYQRYCDDMILICKERATCTAAFNAYLKSLTHLKLPAHEPAIIKGYGKHFWAHKSKSTYLWSQNDGGVPWVQFVGYQLRRDGLTRIRPKSMEKHFKRVLEITNDVLKVLRPRHLEGNLSPDVRKNANQIFYRTKQKLSSLAVGRRKLGQLKPSNAEEIMPMCWSKGFRGLKGKNIVTQQLKALDRHRDRQLRRLIKCLPVEEPVVTNSGPRLRKKHIVKYLGVPFSYFGQFC